MVRSQTTCNEWPPPTAQPGTTAMTIFGMNRIKRCTSKICNRPPDGTVILVPVLTTNALISTRTKCPTTIFWRWAIARQNHTANLCICPRMLKRLQKLVHRLWSKFALRHSDRLMSNSALVLGLMTGNVLKRIV